MTLIFTPRHMDQLVSEIRNEWAPGDPDLRRVADAIPLDVLEATYIAKLDALPPEPVPWLAMTARAKMQVMRRIFAAWARDPKRPTFGQFIDLCFDGREVTRLRQCRAREATRNGVIIPKR